MTEGDAEIGRPSDRSWLCAAGSAQLGGALAHRMGHAQVTRVVVTRADGTLIGLFFAADMNS